MAGGLNPLGIFFSGRSLQIYNDSIDLDDLI